MSSQGTRHNQGKPRIDLVPTDLSQAAARALMFGAAKYAAWNWLKGLSWSETYASLQRHLAAWLNGEDTDPESGLSHLDHAAANIAFLTTFEARGLGTDDRPPMPQPTPPEVVYLRKDLPEDELAAKLSACERAGAAVMWLED